MATFTNFGGKVTEKGLDVNQIAKTVLEKYGLATEEKDILNFGKWINRQMIIIDGSGKLNAWKELKAAGVKDGSVLRADLYAAVGMDEAECEQDEVLVTADLKYFEENKTSSSTEGKVRNSISAPVDFEEKKSWNYENRAALVEQVHLEAARKAEKKKSTTRTKKSDIRQVESESAVDLQDLMDTLA